jgi:hypothetical protein
LKLRPDCLDFSKVFGAIEFKVKQTYGQMALLTDFYTVGLQELNDALQEAWLMLGVACA